MNVHQLIHAKFRPVIREFVRTMTDPLLVPVKQAGNSVKIILAKMLMNV